jgi:hypothetical protein
MEPKIENSGAYFKKSFHSREPKMEIVGLILKSLVCCQSSEIVREVGSK